MSEELALLYGKRSVLHVVPDSKYPAMYRIRRRDGSLSDLGNLTRVKDAAEVIASRELNIHDPAQLKWARGEPLGASYSDLNANRGRVPHSKENTHAET